MNDFVFAVDLGCDVTCEAAGCFAKATDEIPVKVGSLGAISLLLCSDCASKFQEPVARFDLEQSEAEQSLDSHIKEKKVLEQVGSQESNTILSKSTSMDCEEQRR